MDRQFLVLLLHEKGVAIAPLVSHISEFPVHVRCVSLEFPEYQAVQGSEVFLPCHVLPPAAEDSVALVLWYRGDSGEPVYSLDARSGRPEQGRHFPSRPLLARAGLRLARGHGPVATLHINPVLAADEGEYRCRVDFKRGRTQQQVMRLYVAGIRMNFDTYINVWETVLKTWMYRVAAGRKYVVNRTQLRSTNGKTQSWLTLNVPYHWSPDICPPNSPDCHALDHYA
ncbi:hypothetical protein LAZ67_4000183 [Cordylochernes scorpioides]|uniref:Ig-like domain-containing protein n=1 Tax=Cordylochernes scorpioides TaxID=51811 RepID=A0ABY6KD19_9ARAC|nr:hypothetical protein LAZ67_4000183 [Cordylochernes scorpioides]